MITEYSNLSLAELDEKGKSLGHEDIHDFMHCIIEQVNNESHKGGSMISFQKETIKSHVEGRVISFQGRFMEAQITGVAISETNLDAPYGLAATNQMLEVLETARLNLEGRPYFIMQYYVGKAAINGILFNKPFQALLRMQDQYKVALNKLPVASVSVFINRSGPGRSTIIATTIATKTGAMPTHIYLCENSSIALDRLKVAISDILSKVVKRNE